MRRLILVSLALMLLLGSGVKADNTLYVRKTELSQDFILGMDVSSVLSLEKSGVSYADAQGIEKDLFQILKEKGITAKQLAEQIGMSEVGLSVALSENGNPSLSTLRKIATELDVPISDLFEDRKNDGLITCPNCGFSITIEVKK